MWKLRIVGAAMLAAGTASPIWAADWLDAPPAYGPPPVYDWTGFYLGANGGYGGAHVPWTSVPDLTSGTATAAGGLIGGTIGYNAHTISSLVIGEEFDLDWNSINASVPPLSCAPNCELKNTWLGTARLRFGYAVDKWMPYVTGGVAFGDLTADIVGQPFGTQSHINLGWTAGAGVEFVIADPITAKVEYLHVDLNGISCNAACGGGPISTNLSEDIVRVGINYRLWSK